MSKTVKRRLRRERLAHQENGDYIPFKSTPKAPSAVPETEQNPTMTKSAKRAVRQRMKLPAMREEITEICSDSNSKLGAALKKPKLDELPTSEESADLPCSGVANSTSTKANESHKESESINTHDVSESDEETEESNGEALMTVENSPEKITKTKKNLPPKKRRYVLFVGNLSYESKEEDIMEHFKKVGPIISVRLAKHKDSNASRGFCHLELGDEETYLKALSLHHSFLSKRRINVEYSGGQSEDKSVIKHKNMKLHTLNRTGQLSASKAHQNKHAKKFKSKSVQKSRGEFFVETLRRKVRRRPYSPLSVGPLDLSCTSKINMSTMSEEVSVEESLEKNDSAPPVYDDPEPYQEENEMEEIFPWQAKFNKLCRAAVGSKSMKMLENLLTVYLQKVSKTVNDCYMKPNWAGKLKKCMSNAFVFFHLFYQDIKESFENSTYLEKMTELMAMYLDIEIKASRTREERVKKVMCRLISALNIVLDHSENHILDVIIRAKFINKNYKKICSPILRKLLTSLQVYPMNDTLYFRYLLVFKLWKKVVADAEERKNINKIAIQNLPTPSNFKERCKQFNNVVPRVPNKMNSTTFYMHAKFNLKTACQAFMKISKDFQQPIICDKPLFFEGRLAGSQSSFSRKTTSFESGISRSLMNDLWSIAEAASAQKKGDGKGDEASKKKSKDKLNKNDKKKTNDWFDKEKKKNKNDGVVFGNFKENYLRTAVVPHSESICNSLPAKEPAAREPVSEVNANIVTAEINPLPPSPSPPHLASILQDNRKNAGYAPNSTGNSSYSLGVPVPIPVAIPSPQQAPHPMACVCDDCFMRAQNYLFPMAAGVSSTLLQDQHILSLNKQADELKHQDDQLLKTIEDSMKDLTSIENPQLLDSEISRMESHSTLPLKKRHKIDSDTRESASPEGFPNFGLRPMMSILSLSLT